MLPFIIYFGSADSIAPKLSRLFLITHLLIIVLLFITVKFSYLLPIPAFIVFAYLVKRKYRIELDNWIKSGGFKKQKKLPKDILNKLGKDKNWKCFSNKFILKNGKEIPYLVWFGKQFEKMMTIRNGVMQPTAYEISYLAVSFSPQNINRSFQKIVEKLFIEKEMFRDEENFYLSQKFSDNSFAVAWMIEPFPDNLNEKLKEIEEILNEIS